MKSTQVMVNQGREEGGARKRETDKTKHHGEKKTIAAKKSRKGLRKRKKKKNVDFSHQGGGKKGDTLGRSYKDGGIQKRHKVRLGGKKCQEVRPM